jgi:hypothetical protein
MASWFVPPTRRIGSTIGMAEVYEHVTPAVIQDVLATLQNRWVASLNELMDAEYAHPRVIVPAMTRKVVTDRDIWMARVERHGSPIRPTISLFLRQRHGAHPGAPG